MREATLIQPSEVWYGIEAESTLRSLEQNHFLSAAQ